MEHVAEIPTPDVCLFHRLVPLAIAAAACEGRQRMWMCVYIGSRMRRFREFSWPGGNIDTGSSLT
eukprot:5099361-Prymnesium_polylepis.1